MRAFGGTPEQIAQYRATQEPDQTVEVWKCNWRTVKLYLACQLSWLSGMGGATCVGLSQQEIRSVLLNHRVPAQQRPRIARGLAAMGRVAARCYNSR